MDHMLQHEGEQISYIFLLFFSYPEQAIKPLVNKIVGLMVDFIF